MHDVALLAVVQPKWFELATKAFEKGKRIIYFGTSAFTLRHAHNIDAKIVFFKVAGKSEVIGKANLIGFTDQKPKLEERVEMSDDVAFKPYKSYYGFEQITPLSSPIPLSKLVRYTTDKPLLNSTPGSCFVRVPQGPE